MGFSVSFLSLMLWLSAVSAGPVRQLEEYQPEDQPCLTYTIDGSLHIDCSDRGLTELPPNLDVNVQILDLSNNNFQRFPEQLITFNRLERLDLSGNLLAQTLPRYFENLNQLLTLNLSSNNYEVWIGSTRSRSIKILDLSKNKISAIEESAITGMSNLNYLDLSENRIYDIPERTFAGATNLDILILSRNYFYEVPHFQSNSLRSLHLSNCQIWNIKDDALSGMNSLLAIGLSMNQIEHMPDKLASNTLQELDLSYNQITSLTDFTFSALPHLAVLNLRGNDFKEVWPTSHFASNLFLREVHVKGNRWSCEGFSVNLLLTYEFLSSKISDERSLICYTPANVTQMSWQQAYIETWHSADTKTQSFTIMAVMIGIIIGILITSCVCRAMMAFNEPVTTQRPNPETAVLNVNGHTPQARTESVEIRVPLQEDLPPTYDEALLMPRLNASFHSLPDFIDEEPEDNIVRSPRRSRSIGDLTETRPRVGDRRSIRRTVQIHITDIGR